MIYTDEATIKESIEKNPPKNESEKYYSKFLKSIKTRRMTCMIDMVSILLYL